MSKEMYISSSPHETKVAVLEDDQLVEVYFERDTDVGLVGGIYKGRVSRVLPGMQSAFVDIGLERDAFLYVSDFFYEDQEEYDKVFEEAEARATKFTSQQAETRPASAPPAIIEPPPVVAEVAPPVPAPSVAPPPVEAPVAIGAPPVPTPAAAPPGPRESHDRRPFDRRGRRRRHRGRPEFGEGRRGDRPFPPPQRAEEPAAESHEFQILPGESLAKYRHSPAPVEEMMAGVPQESGPGRSVAGEAGAGGDAFQDSVSDEGSEPIEGIVPAETVEASEEMPPPAAKGPEMVSASPIAPEVVESSPADTGHTSPAAPPVAPTVLTESTVAFAPGALQALLSTITAEKAARPVAPPPDESPTPEPAPPEPAAAVPVVEPQPLAEAPAAAAIVEAAPPAVTEPTESTAEAVHPAEAAPPETHPATLASSEVAPETVAEEEVSGNAEEEFEGEEEGLEEGEEFVEGAEEEILGEGENTVEGESALAAAGVEGGGAPPMTEGGAADDAAPAAPGAPGDRTYTLREPHQRPRFAPRGRRRGRRGMGGGGQRRPDNRREPQQRAGGNHHPVQIAEVLKEGQEILVQIAKEPLGTKGARITSHVALPGRYLVFMPTIDHIGVSRKIASEEERLRLRNIILENKGPLSGGFIVRTAGQGRSEEEFKADLKFLSTLWSEIRSKSDRLKAPALIHRDLDLVQRLLRDLLTPDFKCVRVDSEIDYERVLDFVNRCQPALVGKVKLYSRDTPLYEEFGIQQELDKALKPKVWLKSGGYIVINQTEALVAIDVNTGKYVGKTNRLEDTIVKTNVDAVNEIVRQVRLRDLGGIIVIDFIDMDERRNRAKVVQALEEALRSDRAPTKVISFNDFGLVAVTRKRVKQSLERTLCEPCSYCTGSGWVKSVNTICNEILAEAKKMAKGIDGNVITLRVNPEVAKALKSREGGLVSELESLVKKDVIIKSDPMVHQERFEIF